MSTDKMQKLKYLFRLRRFLEDWIFGLGMFGVVLVMVELEVLQQNWSWDMHGYAANPQPRTREQGARMRWSRTSPTTVILKVLLSISTVLLIGLQLARYVTMVKIDVLRNVVPPSSRLWNSPWVLLAFVFEILICAIHVPPMWNDYKAFTTAGSDNYYIPMGYVVETAALEGASDFNAEDVGYYALHYHFDTLNALVIVRVYLFVYWVRNHSGYFSQHASFVGSLHSVDTMSAWFNLKMLFHVRPVSLLIPTTIITTLLTSFVMLVFERPVQFIMGTGIIDWATSVWCTVVTLSTVRSSDGGKAALARALPACTRSIAECLSTERAVCGSFLRSRRETLFSSFVFSLSLSLSLSLCRSATVTSRQKQLEASSPPSSAASSAAPRSLR